MPIWITQVLGTTLLFASLYVFATNGGREPTAIVAAAAGMACYLNADRVVSEGRRLFRREKDER